MGAQLRIVYCVLIGEVITYLNSVTNGTEDMNARLFHVLKIYAIPARIIRATAKNKQIIMPANVL